MAGVTEHGIRYPDGASRAKNLGPELETMAEDIDRVFTDTTEGGVIHEIVEEVAQEVVPPLIEGLVEEALDDYVEQPETSTTAYATPFVSENDRVIGGVYEDGRVEFVKPAGVLPSNPDAIQGRVPLVSENGYVFATIDPDGTVTFAKLGNDTGSGPVSSMREGQTVSDRRRIACSGDSLTEGFGPSKWPATDSWPYKLGQANPNAEIFNLGHSGWTVDEIAVSLGALVPTTTATVTVPAGGTVAISVQSGIGWHPGGAREFPGRLGTVPGTLRKVSRATTTEFTSTASSSQTIPAGASFVPAGKSHAWDLLILGAGRNDISKGVRGSSASVADHVTAGLDRIIQWMKPQRKRILIWGTTNATNERTGSSRYATVMAVNAWCAQKYPDMWVDVRGWLVRDAIYGLGLTPTTEDLAAITADAPPPQIMVDTIHWGKPVAASLTGIFNTAILRRDWKV